MEITSGLHDKDVDESVAVGVVLSVPSDVEQGVVLELDVGELVSVFVEVMTGRVVVDDDVDVSVVVGVVLEVVSEVVA